MDAPKQKQNNERKHERRIVKKAVPRNYPKNQNDVYINGKTNIKVQQKQCEELLNSGAKEIFLHCMGNSIIRGINLTLALILRFNNALSYEIHTSTIKIVDELHPLFDTDDIIFKNRNSSAVHIRIRRNELIAHSTAN